MTETEYKEKYGITFEDAAYIVNDFFVAPLEWTIECEGKLDQTRGRVSHWKGEKPVCGTAACVGGWIAAFFYDSRKYSDFSNPRDANERDYYTVVMLFVNAFEHKDFLELVWHNEYSEGIFYEDDDAYNGDGTTTLEDALGYFVRARDRFMELALESNK